MPRCLSALCICAALAASAAIPRAASAQLPGAPVLQNVWASAGLVGAANVGGGPGGTVFAAAGSWASSSGRFQLSGGIGVASRTNDEGPNADGSSTAYGVRAALPLGARDASFGFGAFAGVGGSSGHHAVLDSITGDTITRTRVTTLVPVGLAVGWRHAIGSSHGFSLYATPSYQFLSGSGVNTGLFRVALGADVGITSSVGVTGGVEFGDTKGGVGGPSGTIYGLGVSYALGRR